MSANTPGAGASQAQRVPPFEASDWWVYRGTGRPIHDIDLAEILPPPPPWRTFHGDPLPANDTPPEDDEEGRRRLGSEFHLTERDVPTHELDMVNAALYLRRPLLVTGNPGAGKSALAYLIARELRLGRVLRWGITSSTTLQSGQYSYDAIGRVQAVATGKAAATARSSTAAPDDAPVGDFVRLGPLGTAFLPSRLPRVLLIDEMDKSESDLPNDLLGIFEEGEFAIPELARIRRDTRQVAVQTADPDRIATIVDGRVACRTFPVVVITSNGEREFPPAFLRRCLQLELPDPNADQLAAMVANHVLDAQGQHRDRLIQEFVAKRTEQGTLPVDRLLEAVYLATSGVHKEGDVAWPRLVDSLWRHLTTVR
jgi:MoxR-like ATPase